MPAIRYRDPRTGQTVPVITPSAGGGVTDHGALTGLADDDHPQYHNDARGDARYVNSTGDTMSGNLAFSQPFGDISFRGGEGAVSFGNGAFHLYGTPTYVGLYDAGYGAYARLHLATPLTNDQAANKYYVDLVGSYAIAEGNFSAGIAGDNAIPLTAITAAHGGINWAISNYRLTSDRAGRFLLLYWGKINGSFTQAWIDNEHEWSASSFNLSSSAANYSQWGAAPQIRRYGAGEQMGLPIIYTAPTPGASGLGRLTAIYLGPI